MKIKYTTVQVGTTVCSYSLPPKHWQLVATTKPYNLGCTERLHSGFSILWWNFIREKLFNRENQICFLKKTSIVHENPPWMAEEWTWGFLSLLCFHGLQNVTVITMLALHSGCPQMVSQLEPHDLLQDEETNCRRVKCSFPGWPQDQLCLRRLRFYGLVNLSNINSSENEFPINSFL